MKYKINDAFAGNTAIEDFVRLLPATFDDGGQTLYADRNVIKSFDVGGMELVVKRFRRPNIVQRLVYTFFRSSKARRAFLSGGTLRERGVQTPLNVAYVEVRRGMLFSDGFYVTDRDNAPPIAGALNDAEQFDRTMAADFACFAARLHENGILHHDLNSTNVLYHPLPDGHYTFSLIDINRMKFYDHGTLPDMGECMENLTRFTGRMDLFAFVAAEYCRCRQLPTTMVGVMVRQKERHDARWVRRKRRVRFLKRIAGCFRK